MRPELEQLFRAHHVILAHLFGSQAEGSVGPLSDVDLAMLLAWDVPNGGMGSVPSSEARVI
ncbi:MAG TPA: nucleotidyltransferase domain-containing protein [Anaerolineae bacterium]|nr:nucleotidyltransferase domain-containing protein [Anaerolineae bacterium]